MNRWRVLVPVLCLCVCVCLASGAMAQRQSGFEFMSPATQALQKDDAQNPAFLWLKDGEQRFDATCARS